MRKAIYIYILDIYNRKNTGLGENSANKKNNAVR